MKKKRLVMIISSIVIIALIGGTYAAFTASTKTEHEVSTTKLGIKLHQDQDNLKDVIELSGFGDQDTTAGFSYQGVPGDTVEEKVWIENTETESCFVRVTVNRSWMEQKADGGFEKTFAEGIYPEEIEIRSDEGWYVVTDPEDPEVLYFYYKEAVPAGKLTTNVMNAFTILKGNYGVQNGNSNAYAGLAANIVFEAEAVQSYGAEEAMLAEWGVVAEISGDQLVGAPEFQ